MRDKTKGRKKPAEKPKRHTLKSSKALAPSKKASYKSKPIKKPKENEARQTLVVNSTTYKAKASLKVIKTKDLKEEKKERESSLPKKYNTKKLLLLKETRGLEEPYMPVNYVGRKDGKLEKVNISKDMHCELNELIEYLEEASGLNLQTGECQTEYQVKVRNEELFPFIKKKGTIVDESNASIWLGRDNAAELVRILSKIYPQLQLIAKVFPNNQFKQWSPVKSIKGKTKDKEILIRRQDLNLHKYDTRNKNLLKILDCGGDFIDEIDLEMLQKKQKMDMEHFRQPTPRWISMAWDAFGLADNHNKSMIFQLPEDPQSEEYNQYMRTVERPITIEAIRQKLNLRFYSNFGEFVEDMRTLFHNWVKFKGENHKMYKYCQQVEKRFETFAEKASQKLAKNY